MFYSTEEYIGAQRLHRSLQLKTFMDMELLPYKVKTLDIR